MAKVDRRVQRTREQLQTALIDLVHERGFATLTIQDIVDRANVGRTTFYLHYDSKDDLLQSCHEAMISRAHFGPLYPLSKEAWLAPETPAGMVSTYQHLRAEWEHLGSIFQGQDNKILLQRFHDWNARQLEASLRAAFADTACTMPVEVLATYLAGAQIALLHAWLAKPSVYTPELMAQTVHRLQRAAIGEALGLNLSS